MILPPSPDRAANTIDGLEYASEVTQVQWKAYLKMVTGWLEGRMEVEGGMEAGEGQVGGWRVGWRWERGMEVGEWD